MTEIERQVVYLCGVGRERRAGFPPGNFAELLINLCFAADDQNLAALAKGFPAVVAAVHAWRHGDLAQRARVEAERMVVT